MESLKHLSETGNSTAHSKIQQLRRRPWCLALVAAIVIVIILVIVIPVAILIPRRGQLKAATVLFPLYIYPETQSTWDPLYQALNIHPQLQFVVIVNPQSGPGPSPSPSDDYVQALQRLSNHTNVQKVGYVRTTYAERNISAVLDDIATYADWSSQSTVLGMDGIFFDEVPHEYSSAMAEYLDTINQAVKSDTGFQSNRMVIHNPGTIPDSRYSVPDTDVIVQFEQSYEHYENVMQARLDSLSESRSSTAYIFHSVPTFSTDDLKGFVDGLSKKAEYLFLTTATERYYEQFDPHLDDFCDAIPT